MITLEVLSGERKGATLEWTAPQLTLGRAQANQLVLPDYHLSSEHGQIFREDDSYIYRDLRSTNGSRIDRAGGLIVLDGSTKWECQLRDGDVLSLGDPAEPVLLRCRTKIEIENSEAAVVAQRNVAELSDVQGKVERDPARARSLYLLLKRFSRSGLNLQAVLASICEAVFELLPLASHVAIDLGDDADPDRENRRLRTAFARARHQTEGEKLQFSRGVIRRVMRDRAAVLVTDASMDLGTESVLAARILSVIAAPLWNGESVAGVIQCDNRAASGFFDTEDLDLMTVLAAQATLAIENARLVEKLRLHEERLRGEVRYLKGREEKRRFGNIIGESAAMKAVFRQLDKVIDTRATVCIEGETGTGKEVIASAIHYQGRRREKLFVAQNCAAMPETLLESELFGHKRGAFTGADHDKKGLFELADGGTLFLDEIGEMPMALQAKLLRVLQEGEIRPVGATQMKQVDVRIIAATNRTLEKEVERGAFRQDLYYRLHVFPLTLPPLRERREDIPLLAAHFLAKYTAEMNKPVAGITPETLDQMAAHSWPGNIRELENEIQRLVIQCEPGAFITPDLLAPSLRKAEGILGRVAPKKGTLKDMMEELERWLLVQALREHDGNKTKTAEALGITREGLHKKLGKYGM